MNKPERINELVPVEQRDGGADPFIGLSYEIDQILLGRNVITAKAKAVSAAGDLLETAYVQRSLTNTKLAAEIFENATAELRVIVNQANDLAAHLAKKSAELLNRRPRA